MFKSGFLLDTNEKIYAAIYNHTNVSIWQGETIIDYGVKSNYRPIKLLRSTNLTSLKTVVSFE